MCDRSEPSSFRLVKQEKKHGSEDSCRHWSRSRRRSNGLTIVAAVGVPIVLGAIGFTSAGIAAGSYAAGMMSTAAVANGGGVVAGGLVATLQAAGAAGLSGAATAVVTGTGAVVGWLVSVIRGKKDKQR
ncbi:interferon alpha-inducible protein 27-like protein 2A isoform X1 [Sebastes umbrosus]|uniref:interferon alpha-inducible protein 27-like protein 2A isoform X1 n=1 Tax=Sebastes umbrosus TaxID=72105 RepID=UPI0018A00B17|nr:interferon alpha-inducible protein 27-like protein 2A isoform X1 [Sebastes umbrosus]XP_037603195.1 interferon alpha-inducible protein 27-like protein 2A isoform X1 [Sebastes umbrosus]